MPRASLFTLVALVGGTALLGSGCQRDEIRTYTVRKDPATSASPVPTSAGAAGGTAGAQTQPGVAGADAMMRNTPVDTASGPALAWDVPAGWTVGPERPMRKATLLIASENDGAGAELAVTAFPGDVGGNLANVNRWRQQLSLPPIGLADLGSALRHIDIGSLHVDVVELVGPATAPGGAQRVLGAIVPYAGATWFFKLTGPDALVAREKDRFFAFLQTVRPAN